MSGVRRHDLLSAQRARLGREVGALRKPGARVPVALVYPSPYHVGMSSLGFQQIYREIHAHPEASAERAFLPDDPSAHRAAGLPLLTYESEQPVGSFPVIAFSLAYELELAGIMECLELAGVPVLAADRDERHPLVVIGGPLTFSNPVPAIPLADVLVLGEAEQTVHVLLDAIAGASGRATMLASLGGRIGLHVPALHGDRLGPIAAVDDERLPACSQILTPDTELSEMFLVEPERGCSRGCTYCVMRRSTNGGMRLVSPGRVLEKIPAHARKVGLVGAAVTDHPKLCEIVRPLVESGRRIGISSLRADRLTPELVGLLARGGYRTLTVASDGASERLREAIERKTREKHLLRAAELCRDEKLKVLKLYMMVGLPGETDDDIDELARFCKELGKIAPRVALGIAPFVAKRNTPLDGAPFEPIRSLEAKLERLRRSLRGAAEVRPTSARWAWVEYRLAQGGVAEGLAALEAYRGGGTWRAWQGALDKVEAAPKVRSLGVVG